MRQKIKEILSQVFVFLTIFLFAVLIYRINNPYSYLGLENRILFVLISLAVVLLYLYLEESKNRNRLLSFIRVTISRSRESKLVRSIESLWERSPSLIRARVSKVMPVLYTYLHKMSAYMLKQDPKQVVSHAFLGMLLIVTLESVIPQLSLGWARTPVMITTVALGTVTFYLNRDKLYEIENEAVQEELEENKRKIEFAEKYPRIYRLWGVRWIGKWVYKEGRFYILILVGILVLFTLIKAPYFDVSFTGEHTMKYNAYVEPAKYMYENNNPFINQKMYTADPVNRPEGIYHTFGKIPLLEWGLLATYTLMPFNSLEVNTRLFTHFIGILILIFAYTFFKDRFSKGQSLIILFLMAINPIISFTTFVTVEDSLLLLFTFISLNYISKYLKENQISHLFFSGLFFGIGVASKYSIILWLVPIVTLLLFFNKKKDVHYLVKSLGIFVTLGMLPTFAFRTSLRYLPTDILVSIFHFAIWVLIFILLYVFITKKESIMDKIVDGIIKNKVFFVGIIISVFFLGIVFLYTTKAYLLFNEFLTDSTLIFNWDMYNHILNKQLKPYMTENVYYLGLIGFVFSLFMPQKQRILLLSFFTGASFYWIMASKVIFFHNYYTNIIMITFCLSVGIMIYQIAISYNNKNIFVIIMLLFSLLIVPVSYDANIERLSKERADQESFMQVAQYLIENTGKNEIYIDDSSLLTLTILTGRSRIDESKLIHDEIKESINKIGFSETMNEYNISYVITSHKTPRYERYVNLFTDEQLDSVSSRRRDIILSKLDSDYHYFSDTDRRNKLIEEHKIKDKFILEKEIGPYKIFAFAN